MLDFESEYVAWRKSRLESWSKLSVVDFTTIDDPKNIADIEYQAIKAQCRQNNLAFYRIRDTKAADKTTIRQLAADFGMLRLDQNLCADNDSISSLHVMNVGRAKGYIPYTNSALNWHTDGYYNQRDQYIRSFLLHCVQSALSGGCNMLINHELIYIHLYDKNPSLIHSLMQPDVMTIPANIENGQEIRPVQSGPVFYRDTQTNTLQMRYTSRSRSIRWKQDSNVQQAIAMIEACLSNDEFVLKYTLQPGEGLLCNNILHGRSAFTNGNIPEQQRVMYRARSYNRLFSGQ